MPGPRADQIRDTERKGLYVHNNTPKRQPRQKVLIVAHSDNFIEVYGDNIDVEITRSPVASSTEAERLAEDIVEACLPPRFKSLYWPGKAKATASLRPLHAQTAHEALFVSKLLPALNSMMEGAA